MKNKQKHRIKLFLLASSVVLITLGLYRGELSVIFSKAINICLECIGIG